MLYIITFIVRFVYNSELLILKTPNRNFIFGVKLSYDKSENTKKYIYQLFYLVGLPFHNVKIV